MLYHTISLIDDDLLLIEFGKFTPSEEQFQRYLDDLSQATIDNPGRSQIFDGSNGVWVPSDLQLMQARYLKENREMIQANVPYAGFIVANRLSKLVMTSVFLLQKPPLPYVVVTDVEIAKATIRQRVARLSPSV